MCLLLILHTNSAHRGHRTDVTYVQSARRAKGQETNWTEGQDGRRDNWSIGPNARWANGQIAQLSSWASGRSPNTPICPTTTSVQYFRATNKWWADLVARVYSLGKIPNRWIRHPKLHKIVISYSKSPIKSSKNSAHRVYPGRSKNLQYLRVLGGSTILKGPIYYGAIGDLAEK